jgi:hypothetical protein
MDTHFDYCETYGGKVYTWLTMTYEDHNIAKPPSELHITFLCFVQNSSSMCVWNRPQLIIFIGIKNYMVVLIQRKIRWRD